MKPEIHEALLQKIITATVCLLLSGFIFVLPVLVNSTGNQLFSNTGVMAADDDGARAPPAARSTQTLGRRVYTRINEVMELRDMELYAEALEVLGEIREDYDRDRLNDREKFVMWQFYANLYQIQEQYPQAIQAYIEMSNLENLTQEQIEQTLYYLGSLYYVEENFREAIDYFIQYNDIAIEPNEDVYYRIGTGYYQLEEYLESIPFILRNMEILRAKNEEISKNTYDLLRALYFNVEDYAAAYQVLRESVVLFDEQGDWVLLPAVLGQIELFTEQGQSYYVVDTLGHLDSDSQLINLAAQLYNNDYPYGCARIMERGMSEGIIEQDESNLSFLSTCYQIAREDEKAAPPLERAAEMSEDGENYARLGRIYSTLGDFEKSIEAFDLALEKGDLDREDQVHLSRARSYMELNRYDEGLVAARAARLDERSEETADTWITVLGREKVRYEALQRQRIELADFFR
jgi:tetratricopeptide (TPR) repeat protein